MLKKWNQFILESKKLDEYDLLMGKLLHLYGSIPVQKEKASIVISKIILNGRKKHFRLGDDIDISHESTHDKVRFVDYFDSLIKSKDIRGHNFEGTICGLYGGDLSQRGEKWDLTINGQSWSVKMVNSGSERIEIGSFFNDILRKNKDKEFEYLGGITKIFRESDDNEIKNNLFDIISNRITGGWIIAYPVYKDNKLSEISVNTISVESMRDLLVNKGLSVAPKSGMKDLFSLALSSTYKRYDGVNKSKIIIPTLTLRDLRDVWTSSDESSWGYNVFGKWTEKIRPDVLRYMKNNSEEISNKMRKFSNFQL